jgi:small basic protein
MASETNAAWPETVKSPSAAGVGFLRHDLATRAVAIAMIAALSMIQLCGLTRYFPIDSWTDRHPFYTNSYALHFARSLLSSTAMAHHLRLWSYSPFLMAGYPAGTRTEPMGDAVALWFWLCSGFSTVRWVGRAAVLYKMFVVGILVCVPAVAASTAVWLGFDWSIATISAALGVFGTFNYPGLMMMRAGMFAFFAASFLCAAWSALLYHSLDGGPVRRVAVAISGGLLTYLHPLTALLLFPASIGCLAECRTRKRLLSLASTLAAVFVISLGWLWPLLMTWDLGVHFAHWWRTSGTVTGSLAAFFRWRLPFPPIAVAAAAAYGGVRAPLRKRFLSSWLAAILGFGVLAYFGSELGALANLEPGRFEVPFFAFAAPLAAYGIHDGWHWLGQIRTPMRQLSKSLAVAVVVFFALVSFASLWLETAAHGPITSTLPDQAQEIWQWMEASERDSRIVMESGWNVDENGGVVAPYFNSDIGLLWAIESNREVIGASPSEGFTVFSFTDLGNGVAFGQPLAQLSPAQFRTELETYNVGSLIAWSVGTKEYLDRVDGLVPLQRSDPYMLYGVAGSHTFLMAGKAGSVSADQDCIRIKAAAPGRLILKYHYFKTLRTDPPIAMSPAPIGNGDAIPFIAIDNDVRRDIRVYNSGFSGWGSAAAACP